VPSDKVKAMKISKINENAIKNDSASLAIRLSMWHWLRITFLLVLALPGCRLMNVDMGSAAAPTVEAIVLPPIEPVTTSSSETLFNTSWDDNANVVQTLAYPHLVFTYDGIRIEGFDQENPPQQYVIYNAGFGYRQRIDWDALWFGDVYGVGSLNIDVYVQPPDADEYSQWESVSTGDIEGWGAEFRDERLDVTIYFSQPGRYRVRAETYVSGYTDENEPTELQNSFDTDVIALSMPPEAWLLQSFEDAHPFLGDLETNGVFMDWRAWSFGPCTLQSDDEAFIRAVDAACQAVETGDLERSADELQRALDLTDDAWQIATIRDQLGLIAAVLARWNIAARHFGEAHDAWESLDNAAAVGRALHNLGNMLLQGGRWREGENALQQAGQLRDQIDDDLGNALTWGQLGVYWDSYDMINDNAQTLSEYGLPQADTLWSILASDDE